MRLHFVVAGVIALLLNLFFLVLMCALISSHPERNPFPEYVGGVEVLNIKPPSPPSPPRRHVIMQPSRPSSLPSSHIIRVHGNPRTSSSFSLKVPITFEINTSLPPLSSVQVPIPMLAPPSPQVSSRTFRVGDLDRPLMVVVKVPPLYPMRARMLGIEGWVKVRFMINKKGYVEDVQIVKSHPPGVFDAVTRDAISKWRFKPPTVGGKPVEVEVTTTIKFKLD